MPIIYMEKITIEDVEANPNALFLYLENVEEKGGSTFIRDIRDCDNSVGLIVKNSNGNSESAYFSPEESSLAESYLDEALFEIKNHLKNKGAVVIPASRFSYESKLEEKSPEVFYALIKLMCDLEEL